MANRQDPFSGLPSPRAVEVARTPGTVFDIATVRLPPIPKRPPEFRPSILIIDDEEALLKSSELVHRATSLKEFADLQTFHLTPTNLDILMKMLAARVASFNCFDVIYVDLNTGTRGGGISLVEHLRSVVSGLYYTSFAIITAYPEEDEQRQAADSRISRFIVKTDLAHGNLASMGLFLHRLIMDAPELMSQADDQLWFDLNEKIALMQAQRTPGFLATAKFVVTFLNEHFESNAIYVRRLESDGDLTLMAGLDGLSVGKDRLPRDDAPFLRDFLNGGMPFSAIPKLERAHLSGNLPQNIVGARALMARIGFGSETVGVVTVYRSGKDRRFRKADGHFLYQLSQQLGATFHREQQLDALRKRQTDTAVFVRQIESLETEIAILEKLRDILHERVGNVAKGEVKTTVRRIIPGTIYVPRAATPLGFDAPLPLPELTLEMVGKSVLADAIDQGLPLRHGDVRTELPGRFVFVSDRIASHLTVPIMSEGVCIGAANLESTQIDAFNKEDGDFTNVICSIAADALIRLRARSFNLGLADLLSKLSIEGNIEPADVIRPAVRLLFDFTGFAELLYLIPRTTQANFDPAWTVTFAYGREGKELTSDGLLKWDRHMGDVWPETFIRRTIEANESVSYTQEKGKFTTDEGTGSTDRGKTKSQAVVLVREPDLGRPVAAVALLFVQKHALNDYQKEFLNHFGRVLGDWFHRQKVVGRILGMLTVRDQEAQLGRIYGQFRHNLHGQLSLIRQNLRALSTNATPDMLNSAKDGIEQILAQIKGEIDRSRDLVKRPEAQNVDLRQAWQSVRKDLAGVAEENSACLEDGKFSTQSWVTDGDILRSILFNLADNAIRYGGLGVRVWPEVSQNADWLTIDVIDTGPGIRDCVLSRLFEPNVTTGGHTTGMGLYLSRLRATDLGGDLAIVETSERGTCFRLRLPVAPSLDAST